MIFIQIRESQVPRDDIDNVADLVYEEPVLTVCWKRRVGASSTYTVELVVKISVVREIRTKDFGKHSRLRRLEREGFRKMDVQLKATSSVGRARRSEKCDDQVVEENLLSWRFWNIPVAKLTTEEFKDNFSRVSEAKKTTSASHFPDLY